ncbi:hypothetical protein HTV45_30445 [Streptomyces sp. CHD11]|uniref:CAP domain-containing protein n=1 Tax=Streptomyces sp. CHD11 TaxID=2741325 RepID=UPI001BFC7229|nr:CAP domain-containing protein [Streptomyces sp. CHD11]MBT3155145.1 hypothetical protein [Streptomyces sp. CHD11]
MNDMVPGGNLALPGGAVTIRVTGPFDVSALITDDGGKAGGDGDFVFYSQPSAPGARLAADTLTVDPRALRSGACRVTVAVSPAAPGTPLSALPAAVLQVADAGGRPLAARRTVGENIACGQRSAAEVVEGWMNSPGHRANILKAGFTHIGVGFAGGGRAGTYWTQLFGA